MKIKLHTKTVQVLLVTLLFLFSVPTAFGYTEKEVDDGTGTGGTVVIAVHMTWLSGRAYGEHWAPPPGTGELYVNGAREDSCSIEFDVSCYTAGKYDHPCDVWAEGRTTYLVYSVTEWKQNCA